MSAIRNVAQGLRNLWGQGGDDDYEDDDVPSFQPHQPQSHHPQTVLDDELPPAPPSRYVSSSLRGAQSEPGDEHQPYVPSSRVGEPFSASSSGSGGLGNRRLRPVAMPLRGREKNVYTLKPKSMDEASVAADYLKTGCAVILNMDDLNKSCALRLVDFMSGVCYGLDNQGHAMKLGETIFLFTPGDYEITSDEADYGENREPLFKDESHEVKAPAQGGERRSWER